MMFSEGIEMKHWPAIVQKDKERKNLPLWPKYSVHMVEIS